uniref:Uncharacterized protein n=1 Tax=Nymphaea colorata TaxID=210225 RepID=A0A5K0XZW3_9MAGN
MGAGYSSWQNFFSTASLKHRISLLTISFGVQLTGI